LLNERVVVGSEARNVDGAGRVVVSSTAAPAIATTATSVTACDV